MQGLVVLVASRVPPQLYPMYTHPRSVSAGQRDPCPGFPVCPTVADFPQPYNGTYPESYPYSRGMYFPKNFTWMLGTASYQIEGAYNEDGRGASIWDTFSGANTVGMPGSVCAKAPCSVNSVQETKGATGNVANNHYHLYDRDVAVLGQLGLNSYRFSIAWPRIFPTGHVEDGANAKGVAFYHRLIDGLLAAGITPIVTLYHWDLPQGLLDAKQDGSSSMPTCDPRYKQGWFECTRSADGTIAPTGASSNAAVQFGKYAEFVFKQYGSKVKVWATFNEAWTFTFLGSGYGKAPSVQPYMDNDIWPYVAGHNVIFAHLAAVKVFRKLQADGTLTREHAIGITNNQDWREPKSFAPQDIAAAQAQLEGQLGWYCDPIYGVGGTHDYPDSMKRLRPYMPVFSDADKAELQANTPDFFGLNHYGTGFVSFDPATGASTVIQDGIVQGQSVWLYGAGWGFRKLLNWVSKRYSYPTIYCTEAGWSVAASNSLQAKYDAGRTMYYYSYLFEAHRAMYEDGVDLRGFASWSFADNFEWEKGYTERFGVMYNDFNFQPLSDLNAPTQATPVYNAQTGKLDGTCGIVCAEAGMPNPATAMNQTRHAKNSLLWLQWLWRSSEIPDPARFLTGSIGGDVCYGAPGSTYIVSGGKTVPCDVKSSVPGEPPVCPKAYGQCDGTVGPQPFVLPSFCPRCPAGFVCIKESQYYSQCEPHLTAALELG